MYCSHIKFQLLQSRLHEPTMLTSGKEAHQTKRPKVRMVSDLEVANHVCIHINIHNYIVGYLFVSNCTCVCKLVHLT